MRSVLATVEEIVSDPQDRFDCSLAVIFSSEIDRPENSTAVLVHLNLGRMIDKKSDCSRDVLNARSGESCANLLPETCPIRLSAIKSPPYTEICCLQCIFESGKRHEEFANQIPRNRKGFKWGDCQLSRCEGSGAHCSGAGVGSHGWLYSRSAVASGVAVTSCPPSLYPHRPSCPVQAYDP
jgi:hypothetical protein